MQGFHTIPLPSNKVLWEARSESIWENEYHINRRDPKWSWPESLGRLSEAQDRSRKGISNDVRQLDEWNSGLDGLGMLINMALTECW